MAYYKSSLDAKWHDVAAAVDNDNSFTFWLILATESIAEYEPDLSLIHPCYFNTDKWFRPKHETPWFFPSWLIDLHFFKQNICYIVYKPICPYKISLDALNDQGI